MQKKLLVMGIDPGTTAGYAFLDITGNLVEVNSRKELPLSELIEISIGFGRVIVVGTDKKNVPGFVDEFATKIGAKVVSPEQDLLISEKKEMVNFEVRNHHEFDALASAKLAYNNINGLLGKISVFAKRNNKTAIEKGIIELVIKKGISIRGAVDLIEKSEHAEEAIMRKVFEKKQASEKDFVVLYNQFKKLEQENRLLQKHSRNQQRDIDRLRRSHQQLAEKSKFLVWEEKAEKIREFRQAKLDFLSSQLRKTKDVADNYKAHAEKLAELINSLDHKMVVKFLEDLNWDNFQESNKILKIKKGDAIYVENTSVVSKKTIEYLAIRVKFVFYKKPLSKMLEKEKFIFIDSSNLKFERYNWFLAIGRSEFEKETKSREVMKQILMEYRRERNTGES